MFEACTRRDEQLQEAGKAEMADEASLPTVKTQFIDAHHHFQDLTHHCYSWLSDKDAPEKLEGDLALIRRDYLPKDYRSDLDSVDLAKSVHIQHGWDASDPVGETRWLERVVDSEGLPDAIVFYADLASPDVEATLEAHASCSRVRGV